ncbi:MAG: ATP-binding protein [Bacteroidia bacterium]|nr:ATP-binding protein [Bacteroidia bacterium]
MIKRYIQEELLNCLKNFPVTIILGPRQIGKTTLANTISEIIEPPVLYLDLEKNSHLQRLINDAEAYLIKNSDKLIIIDEMQRMPHLFPLLRSLIDMSRKPGRFLLLGSSSPKLVKGISESLAGRIAYVDLSGINIQEAFASGISQEDLWLKGGFPVPLLSNNNESAFNWYQHFIRSYIEKDMNELFGVEFLPKVIERFWQMIAHNSSSLWNNESYSRALGISTPTLNRYLNYMEGAFLLTRLSPWFFNINKRLVKSPKIYIRDTGILHYLNNIYDFNSLFGHTIVGASWEGFVIEQIRQLKNKNIELYFYRTHQGAETDLVLVKTMKPIALIEIKLSTAPQVSKGFYQCIEDLKTAKNYVIMPSGDVFPAKNSIWCYNLHEFLTEVLPTIT